MSSPQRQHDHQSGSDALIDEAPCLYLPRLADILSNDNEARLLQQINYWLNNPYFDQNMRIGIETRKYRGLQYAKISPQFFLDPWHGKFRNWSKATLERTIKALKDKAVLLTENFGATGNTNWYAIRYEVINDYNGIFQEFLDIVKREREEARNDPDNKRGDISPERQEQLKEELKRVIKREMSIYGNVSAPPSYPDRDYPQIEGIPTSLPLDYGCDGVPDNDTTLKLRVTEPQFEGNGASICESDTFNLAPPSLYKESSKKFKEKLLTVKPTKISEVLPVVVSFESSIESANAPEFVTDNKTLVSRLIKLGAAEKIAHEIAKRPDICEKQIEFLPHRDNVKAPGGTLVKSIVEDWSAPPRYLAKIEAEKLAEAAKSATIAANAEKARSNAEKANAEARREALDKRAPSIWNALDDETRARMEKTARDRLTPLQIERDRKNENNASFELELGIVLREYLAKLPDQDETEELKTGTN